MDHLKLAAKMSYPYIRKTKFGKRVDSIWVVIGLFIGIACVILAIIGAIDYLKKNKKTFGNVSYDGKTEILLYSYKECGHCKDFKKEWNKLIELTKNNMNIHTEEIELTANPARIQKDGIMYFPTIKINGKEYDGERTAEAILRAAKK